MPEYWSALGSIGSTAMDAVAFTSGVPRPPGSPPIARYEGLKNKVDYTVPLVIAAEASYQPM